MTRLSSWWAKIIAADRQIGSRWWGSAAAIVLSLFLTVGMLSVFALLAAQTPSVTDDVRLAMVGLVVLVLVRDLYMAYHQFWRRRQEEIFRLVSENAADMIALVDADGHRIYNSPSYKRILGYSPEELERTSAFEQVHPDDRQFVLLAAQEARKTGTGRRLEYRIRHKDGTWRVLESTASTIRDLRGKVEKLVIVNRDITERKRMEEQLEHSAFHDALTDLPNRSLFLDRLQHAFDHAKRNPSYKFAVLFVAVDGVTIFNNTMGHTVSDQLIVDISERLTQCLRHDDTITRSAKTGSDGPSKNDVLARLDGDEFTILLDCIKDPSDAMRAAMRIQDILATPFRVNGVDVYTSASIGIAVSTVPCEKADDLLRDADIAMLRAKSLGSPCEVFDRNMHVQVVKRLQLETALRKAIERQEFRVFYQPIVSLTNGRIAGFEALVRWQHPDTGLVSPAEFMTVAEETGLIIPLGKWVLEGACQQARLWQLKYPGTPAIGITVNVSAKQFMQTDFVAEVKSVVEQTGIAPQSLQLEITETMAMSDPERSGRVLAQLRKLGVRISIDDFGTGYSSLSRLRSFPVDVLKIDRCFITGMEKDGENREIVRLIVRLAHHLHLKVIAEGTELDEHVQLLRQFGCEFGQGYFFSPAVDQVTAQALLRMNADLERKPDPRPVPGVAAGQAAGAAD